jgi:hypothetical protein
MPFQSEGCLSVAAIPAISVAAALLLWNIRKRSCHAVREAEKTVMLFAKKKVQVLTTSRRIANGRRRALIIHHHLVPDAANDFWSTLTDFPRRRNQEQQQNARKQWDCTPPHSPVSKSMSPRSLPMLEKGCLASQPALVLGEWDHNLTYDKSSKGRSMKHGSSRRLYISNPALSRLCP